MPTKRIRDGGYVQAAVLLCSAIVNIAVAMPTAQLSRVSQQDLCVTEGTIESSAGKLLVNVPKMRAYVNATSSQIVEARFTYLGPTSKDIPLGSGEMRRQFGLKLRAADACNLVYAMWRIEPQPKLVVSVKSNPGQHTSNECGNRGYTNIKARRGGLVPMLRPGDPPHALRAEMNGDQLRVFVDNLQVWEGSVGAAASAMQGPVGIRSDNARLQLELFAAESTGSAKHGPACRTGAEAPE
jgi:hypothetical protein